MASKKDYNAIAAKIKAEVSTLHKRDIEERWFYQGIFRAVCLIGDVFEKDNPRFNRTKFLSACGL